MVAVMGVAVSKKIPHTSQAGTIYLVTSNHISNDRKPYIS